MTNLSMARTKADEAIHAMAQHLRYYRPFGPGWKWNALLMCVPGVSTPVVIDFCLGSRAKYLNLGTALILLPILIIFVRSAIEFASGWRLEQKLRALFRTDSNSGWQSVSSATIPSLLDILPCATRDHSDLLPRLAALLNKLLKSLRTEDAMRLTKEQRDVLHELIMPICQDGIAAWYATELSEAQLCELRPTIIAALALLGNATSIPALERFAAKTDGEDLRPLIVHSIERIRERLHQRPGEMLRASIAPERPDMLLRAAISPGPQNQDPRQLLRPDHAPNSTIPKARNRIREGSET